MDPNLIKILTQTCFSNYDKQTILFRFMSLFLLLFLLDVFGNWRLAVGFRQQLLVVPEIKDCGLCEYELNVVKRNIMICSFFSAFGFGIQKMDTSKYFYEQFYYNISVEYVCECVFKCVYVINSASPHENDDDNEDDGDVVYFTCTVCILFCQIEAEEKRRSKWPHTYHFIT